MKKCFILFFLFLPAFLWAQKGIDSISQLEKTYTDYFKLNREAVFLQLNKAKVLPTENIWFSAYVFDPRTQKPNLKTTNLHVNVYDSHGKLVKAETIYIRKGKGEGTIELDTVNFKPGKYFIRAFTKYMANFREDMAFVQAFEILGSKASKAPKARYDLQLLPEGGHLLADAQNTIGVKLINAKGFGVPFDDGKVVNAAGQTLTTFKSNKFGMGKFPLFCEPDENYTVWVSPKDGNPISVALKRPDLRGLALSANTLSPNLIYLKISTNPATLKQVGGKQFYIAIHREGAIETIPFVFPKDKTSQTISIDKKVLAKGVNVITIFNQDFKPLLERQVFNGMDLNRKRVHARLFKTTSDSLIINLSSSIKGEDNSLSISVLPAGTKAYAQRNGILSAFYLGPFIKGTLEHGRYYFSDGQKRRKAYDLDLLLLTQGWSKYKWRNIFAGPPKEYFKPEHGFTISGRVNKRNKETEKYVMIKGKSLFLVAPLDAENHFEMDRLFIADSAKIAFGLTNTKTKKVSIPKIYARMTPLRDNKSLGKVPLRTFSVPEDDGKLSFKRTQKRNKTTFRIWGKRLDTIVVRATEVYDTNGDNTRTYIYGHRKLITKDMAESFTYITDYIASQGYVVDRGFTGVSISTLAPTSLRGQGHPLVILDGMPITGSLIQIANMRTLDVQSITINRHGFGYGMRGAAGVIKIKTKVGQFVTSGKPSQTTVSIKMKNGFAQNKEFYRPMFSIAREQFFTEYMAISWLPNVHLDANGNKTLKVLDTPQDAIKLFIQGMTADGGLISEILVVK